MRAETRNILHERDCEAERAQREAKRQRRVYHASIARVRPLTHKPFAMLAEKIFSGEEP